LLKDILYEFHKMQKQNKYTIFKDET